MNGMFLKIEVYIAFTWILTVCYQRLSNAAIIGLCESKLDASVLEQEINIHNYKILRCDRNRHGRGVACHIRNDLSYNILSVIYVIGLWIIS